MIELPREFMDAPLIVLLEFGGSIRCINHLERKLNIIWIRQLQHLTRQDLLGTSHLGPVEIGKFTESLEAYRQHCIEKENAVIRISNLYCTYCSKSRSSDDVKCKGWSRVSDAMAAGQRPQGMTCKHCGHPVEFREQSVPVLGDCNETQTEEATSTSGET